MKRGFTVLELLAASLLLSLLVTALTMIFNQSSIAWRTGVADVVELGKTRAALGTYHDIEDDALPGLGQTGQAVGSRDVTYRTVSMFKNWNGGTIGNSQSDQAPGRLYDKIQVNTGAGINAPAISDANARKGQIEPNVGSGSSQGGDAYIVGVLSCGPDREEGTADDISTYPKEVQ